MNTNKYKQDIDNIINELKLFENDILTLNLPINNELIIQFENKYNLKLPNDYKYLLTKSNGIGLMGDEITLG